MAGSGVGFNNKKKTKKKEKKKEMFMKEKNDDENPMKTPMETRCGPIDEAKPNGSNAALTDNGCR